jgi:hypothetical protein
VRTVADSGNMIVRIAALFGALLLLAACSTEEGLRAQQLLQQAEAAQQALRSSTFEGSLTATFAAQNFEIAIDGATAPEGEWISIRGKGLPGVEDLSAEVVRRGTRAWTRLGGRWESMPVPAGAVSGGSLDVAAFQGLTQHVKDVRVTEHQVVGGRTVSVIAGEIDTKGMLEALMKLGSVAGESQGFSLDFAELGLELGDIKATLTIDEGTRLLTSALITFAVDAKGERLELELRYRLTSANEPVRLPTP